MRPPQCAHSRTSIENTLFTNSDHGTAMDLLQHGVDRAVIALWLGHESVETIQM